MSAATPISDTLVDDLMKGAVDLHVHSGPSVMARLVDHMEALEQASAAGMRAVLFKDHYYPTAPIAEMIRAKTKGGAEPLGGIVLNNALGGFNVYAVEHALKLGTRIVWMPTVSAANHIREGHNKKLLVAKSEMRRPTALSAVDEHGELKEEVKPILDLVAQYDAVLSCGHLHISEAWVLFEEAKRRGCKRLLVNHPPYTVGAAPKDVKRLLDLGVMIEHSACLYIDCRFKVYTPEQLKEWIDTAGVDNTFFGSDLGQANCPSPVEGMKQIVRTCLTLGYTPDEVRRMVSSNAMRLAGIGDNAPAAAA
ncbi:DUF6282 family protein [Rhodoplanes sp. TEM]|uniref:DUF6282 family protein n=1 Tax=Rhodoplanes tepidamans TaxID=200616 RepID=A0ABT5JJ25_RHOTP|nr:MULTISPECIES: DUF6282 family protein [Rhodoplanes]MDC7789714.1 DUF6282 family protein [Rhodoplanes tepidamans]MDC7985863.1 DUF6282 family protein [Rhodoplanes sp. TEM]MDQ0354391.1 hypothetical protein [Rhodoplanes tepidamans]